MDKEEETQTLEESLEKVKSNESELQKYQKDLAISICRLSNNNFGVCKLVERLIEITQLKTYATILITDLNFQIQNKEKVNQGVKNE